MGITVFLVGFATALQGILSKCDLPWVLGLTCMINGVVLAFWEDIPLWGKVVSAVVLSAALGAVIYFAGVLDMLYLGRIGEYRFAAAEATLVLALNLVAMLPAGRKRKALSQT